MCGIFLIVLLLCTVIHRSYPLGYKRNSFCPVSHRSLLCRVATKLYSSSLPNHLNHKVYPDDNYDHILGFGDITHKNSKLQEICRLRIADVELSKSPIDTVSSPVRAIYGFKNCIADLRCMLEFAARMRYWSVILRFKWGFRVWYSGLWQNIRQAN